ncbi:unnamed protein product [Pleuronectes platessa]|uniref:Uncharacterized protein n=1 Tax=Pleuronectes platessa TaxID=8262 RepID=A0A9N7VBU0_PLEPL|nr:unnamed protein product [Pleuronectes platessa]
MRHPFGLESGNTPTLHLDAHVTDFSIFEKSPPTGLTTPGDMFVPLRLGSELQRTDEMVICETVISPEWLPKELCLVCVFSPEEKEEVVSGRVRCRENYSCDLVALGKREASNFAYSERKRRGSSSSEPGAANELTFNTESSSVGAWEGLERLLKQTGSSITSTAWPALFLQSWSQCTD